MRCQLSFQGKGCSASAVGAEPAHRKLPLQVLKCLENTEEQYFSLVVQQYLQLALWHPVCLNLPCGFSVMLLFWAVNVVHSLQFKELKYFILESAF